MPDTSTPNPALPNLRDTLARVTGDRVLEVSFLRRRRDLEHVLIWVWALKTGGFCGFCDTGQIERLSPPRLDFEAAIAAIVRAGYRDDLENAKVSIKDTLRRPELEYTYRHKAYPPLGAAVPRGHGSQ